MFRPILAQGVSTGSGSATLAWSFALEGWQSATHVRLAGDALGISVVGLAHGCASQFPLVLCSVSQGEHASYRLSCRHLHLRQICAARKLHTNATALHQLVQPSHPLPLTCNMTIIKHISSWRARGASLGVARIELHSDGGASFVRAHLLTAGRDLQVRSLHLSSPLDTP